MKKILNLISDEMMQAFEQAGYERALGKVTPSNRPDLCEYQCNGAMAGAKQYKKAPIMIANDVAAKLSDSAVPVQTPASFHQKSNLIFFSLFPPSIPRYFCEYTHPQ